MPKKPSGGAWDQVKRRHLWVWRRSTRAPVFLDKNQTCCFPFFFPNCPLLENTQEHHGVRHQHGGASVDKVWRICRHVKRLMLDPGDRWRLNVMSEAAAVALTLLLRADTHSTTGQHHGWTPEQSAVLLRVCPPSSSHLSWLSRWLVMLHLNLTPPTVCFWPDSHTHTHKEKLIREDRSRSLQPASVLLTLKWVLSRCQQRWRLMTPPSPCLLVNNAYSSLSPTMLLLQPTQLTQTQTRTEVNGTSRVGKSSYFVPSTG